jgi:hypothetical protein
LDYFCMFAENGWPMKCSNPPENPTAHLNPTAPIYPSPVVVHVADTLVEPLGPKLFAAPVINVAVEISFVMDGSFGVVNDSVPLVIPNPPKPTIRAVPDPVTLNVLVIEVTDAVFVME